MYLPFARLYTSKCGDKTQRTTLTKNTKTMSLPTDTRGEAAGSNYFAIEPGQNEILIVGPAITGYQYWRDKGGPVRQPEVFDEPLPDDARMRDVKDKNGNVVGREKEKQQFYWAMPVYNFKTKNFELAQFTQKGIRDGLLSKQNNPNWGDPVGKYTITIDKSGTSFQTKYTVEANPADDAKKAEIAAIMEKYNANPIDVAGDLFGVQAATPETAAPVAEAEPVEAPAEAEAPADVQDTTPQAETTA